MIFILLLFFISYLLSTSLPGIAPISYPLNSLIPLKVKQLDSIITQIPYEYYSLPFCQPKSLIDLTDSLGEILIGDVIQDSDYSIKSGNTEYCKILCRGNYNKIYLKQFEEKIVQNYKIHWLLDDLPAATKFISAKTSNNNDEEEEGQTVLSDGKDSIVLDNKDYIYSKGFALGYVEDGNAYINNHIRMTVLVNEAPDKFEGLRVVGFEVEPFSINHKYDEFKGKDTKLTTCQVSSNPQSVTDPENHEIIWTYDVIFKRSPIKWSNRWEVYLKSKNSGLHWWSVMNNFLFVLVISSILGLIMIRILRKDLQKYNDEAADEEAEREESGWKVIHADVFRPPANAGTLAALVGSGIQIMGMSALCLVFGLMDLLSPANRGGLLTTILVVFFIMGSIGGFCAARLGRLCEVTDWATNALPTATIFPGVCFFVYFVVNMGFWKVKSSAAVPFGTLVVLLILWVGVATPLVYLGAWYGAKSEFKSPVKVNIIPRVVPDPVWYLYPLNMIVVGGVLPFLAIFTESYVILSSVWLHEYYYMFGFLAVVFIVLIIVCSEIAIVFVYFQLSNEDFNWWWRSFLTVGSSGLYLFLYSIIYFNNRLEITNSVSMLMYFGYMFLASFALFILAGSIGFIACLIFIYHIYSSIKID